MTEAIEPQPKQLANARGSIEKKDPNQTKTANFFKEEEPLDWEVIGRSLGIPDKEAVTDPEKLKQTDLSKIFTNADFED